MIKVRKPMVRWGFFIVATSLLLSLHAVAARAPRFRIYELETPPGFESVAAVKINNRGQVLVNAFDAAGRSQPFLYNRNGAARPLDVGEHGGYAYNLNDRGDVVGFGVRQEGPYFFIYHGRNGSITDLSAATGEPISRVMDINNEGVVVGNVRRFNGPDPFNTYGAAFVYSDGQFRLLDVLPGGFYSDALSINDSGQIAGQSSLLFEGGIVGHAAVWDEGGVHDLGTLPGTTHSVAWSINDLGQVAGYGGSHGFLYSAGHMEALGNLPGHFNTLPYEINNHGHIVGASSQVNYVDYRGFLYVGGVLYDLNDLIPSHSGWFISWADGINDRGEIVGWGFRDGRRRAFLLRPLGPLWRLGRYED